MPRKKKKYLKLRKFLKRHKYKMRYALLIGGFLALRYFQPGLVDQAQDMAIDSIAETTSFLKRLYSESDKLLEVLLGFLAL